MQLKQWYSYKCSSSCRYYNIGILEKYLYYFYLQGADLTKPIDKKLYKGISPTCHDFNSTAITEDSLPLIVGFSTGLVQLIDPVRKDVSVLFNEEVSHIF